MSGPDYARYQSTSHFGTVIYGVDGTQANNGTVIYLSCSGLSRYSFELPVHTRGASRREPKLAMTREFCTSIVLTTTSLLENPMERGVTRVWSLHADLPLRGD